MALNKLKPTTPYRLCENMPIDILRVRDDDIPGLVMDENLVRASERIRRITKTPSRKIQVISPSLTLLASSYLFGAAGRF